MRDEQVKELEAAARGILKYLKIEGEAEFRNAIYESPAQALRRRANEIEERDTAIYRLRQILLNLEEK